ncbi:metallophosphoesterase [Sphaerochaeta globosa]|uniref:Metallophosphoesterase n=1 Tax=Sphaerochaeta globosa (strain ATCC BAA-1886 / DSM 22777 / Buddy) TaxID=158189 RepID=F0RYH9_SPHGB|nr:metallophosphoesterase [Sphaerochaeta globosa]ADY12750.1 metallophosphoesterase [Sphaerochaeta globosa str. Buddy]
MKRSASWVLKTVVLSLAILLIALGIATYLVIMGLNNTRIYQEFDRHTELFSLAEEAFNLETAIFEQKAFSLPYTNDSFTILWGTDFHLRRGPFSGRDKIYAMLEKAFDETNPDLTVISGDLLYSFDSLKMLTEFADFMQEHNRVWALSFGNHDGQHTHDKPTLANLLDGYPTALFSQGEDWVAGNSNYPIVLTKDGQVVQAIILLDSQDSRVYEGGVIAPDYLYPSQIAWYRWVEDGLTNIPLYAFMHIPVPEFKLLWESGTALGVQLDRKVNVPLENSGLFEAMHEIGNTVAIFSGHDHLNDFSGTWEGIDLNYGRSASYGSYGSKYHSKGIKSVTLFSDGRPYEVVTYTVDTWGL